MHERLHETATNKPEKNFPFVRKLKFLKMADSDKTSKYVKIAQDLESFFAKYPVDTAGRMSTVK